MIDNNLQIKKNGQLIIRWLIIIIVLLIVTKRAWVSDDAYITLRTVDNFINGYGLTWNVNERVEVYTHPLWMLLLSFFYLFTHEAYLTTIFVSLGLVLFTLVYLQFKIKPLSHLILVFLVLGLSNAFVDFSTSGLENALSYTLITLLFFQFFNNKSPKENYFIIVFNVGLIGLNRLDLLLLVFPVLIFVFFQQPNKWIAIKYGLLALSPFIVWEIVSYIYYGYLFPNTYYAKINSGISSIELILQGFFYFIASLKRDPLTLLIIFFGIIFGLLNKNMIIRLFSFGLLLYLGYILKIGGDFMVGRFLVIPFLISIFVLFIGFFSKLDGPKIVLTSLLTILVGILSPTPTFQQLNPNGYFEAYHGIVDEREIYYYGTSLFRYGVFNFEPGLDWIEDGRELNRKVENFEYHLKPYLSIGYLGYYAGPKIYIIDRSGLGNAFLAHQSISDFTDWRIGHYKRGIEEDYLMSLELGKNLIIDKDLADLFEDVVIRTQYDVSEKSRLKYILTIDNIQ